MSTNWDLLVENHFVSRKQKPLYETLSKLINQVVEETLDAASGQVIEEQEQQSGGQTRTYTIKQIPLIPISELGWANNDDGAQGGTQRSLLEDWLSNIEGNGFQDKLDNVQVRMREGFRDIKPEDNNVQKYIQEVMSYLVFVKTLTMAITNFNASAAGFNFEAFLATLMAGSQIPASGAKTIADFTAEIDGDVVPVSLKLYTEGQLEVGGSYTDLVNDMVTPNESWAGWANSPEYEGGAMKYVVCTKNFEKGAENPLERKGVINFYEFDISRANIFRLLAEASTFGKKVIGSSVDFMSALQEWDKTREGEAPDISRTLPTKTDKGSPDEVTQAFSDFLMSDIAVPFQEAGYTQEQIEAIVNGVAEIYLDRIKSTESVLELGAYGPLKAAIANGAGIGDSDAMTVRNDYVIPSFKRFKADVIQGSDKRGEAMSKMNWMFGEKPELVTWYEGLSPEAKAIALQNTYGYLNRGHWKIPNKKAIGYGGGEPFAVLPIGAPYVQELLDSVQNEVMDEVFNIFDRMAEMSDKLNSFFANGLKEKGEAEQGAEAGEEAAAGAREFVK
jgi:hypothetical protein